MTIKRVIDERGDLTDVMETVLTSYDSDLTFQTKP